jgi:hypothetical protein
MTWFTQSANETEAAKEHAHINLAGDFDFPSAHLRVWSGLGTVQIDGNDFLGVGQQGAVSEAPDNVRLVAERKTYRLSGVDPSLVSQADIDASFGRSVTEYFFFLTEAGVKVADPEINWEGRIDSINRVDSDTPYIEATAENRMVMLDRPNDLRYTHEHQQQFFPGDDGLKLVPTTMTANILWGGYKANPGRPDFPRPRTADRR